MLYNLIVIIFSSRPRTFISFFWLAQWQNVTTNEPRERTRNRKCYYSENLHSQFLPTPQRALEKTTTSRQFVIPFSFFYILNSYTIYTLKCRVDPGPERNSHSDTAKAEEGKKSILWHSSSRIANRVEELSVVSEIKWNGRNRKRVENIIIIIYSLSFVQKNTEKELYAVRGYKIVELGRASR